MGRIVKWPSLLLSLFLLLKGFSGSAQLIPADSVRTTHEIIAYSADRTGNIFVETEGGSIIKYSRELDSLAAYNPSRVGDFKLIEAWHGFQVFAFSQKFQDFVLLDRFLARENRYNLGETGMYFVDLATISSDQNLWLFEENGLRLMKYNFRSGETVLEVNLDQWLTNSNHEFSFIREYQNLIFLQDIESGTYVFDNMGNFIKQINTGGANYLSFYNESAYFLRPGELVQLGLYSNDLRAFRLPNKEYIGAIVFNDQVFLFETNIIRRFVIPKN